MSWFSGFVNSWTDRNTDASILVQGELTELWLLFEPYKAPFIFVKNYPWLPPLLLVIAIAMAYWFVDKSIRWLIKSILYTILKLRIFIIWCLPGIVGAMLWDYVKYLGWHLLISNKSNLQQAVIHAANNITHAVGK